MLNINNNVTNLKKDILVRIAKLQLEGKLITGVRDIPKEIRPLGSEPTRCCIYQDREILRMRILARMGFSIEDFDDDKPMSDYAMEAMGRQSPTWPMLTVLNLACNACTPTQHIVTNQCQGCLARPCYENCPKKAISFVEGHAFIDKEKCVNCGLCLQNCPYHAIIKKPVPCEEACPVGAIAKGEDGREHIDYDKCIFCGRCMSECPFGAMMDKGQLVDVIRHIQSKQKDVVALYAPAIAAQFKASSGQLESALEALGFKVVEVARGADICADKEAAEFEERMKDGHKMMTTSCCPAYVRAVQIHAPELKPCISETRSPMHYAAEIAKSEYPDCITVFVGPCLAKRREGFDDDLVDYVLSVEELDAFLIAKGVDITKIAEKEQTVVPTASGREFAVSGGVANSVKIRLHDQSILRPAVIDGLSKAGVKQLQTYGKINAGKMPSPPNCPNLIEVMACEGGCISGPSVITAPKMAAVQIKKYVAEGTPDIVADKNAAQ